MSHEPFETQAAVYALGALDGEECARFEEHLAGCAACAAAVRGHAETLADVARDAPPMIPPARVKADLMRRVAAVDSSRASQRRRRLVRWTVASAAAVVGVSAFAAGFVASRYEARIGAMARETGRVRDDLRRQEAALRDRLALSQGVIDLLGDPTTRVVVLRGSSSNPDAVGRLVWHDANGGYLLVANVPPAPAGRVYELWTISAGQPRPAGVFTVDASGRATHSVAPTRSPVEVFAVTLEPEGGVSSPTGPTILASAK